VSQSLNRPRGLEMPCTGGAFNRQRVNRQETTIFLCCERDVMKRSKALWAAPRQAPLRARAIRFGEWAGACTMRLPSCSNLHQHQWLGRLGERASSGASARCVREQAGQKGRTQSRHQLQCVARRRGEPTYNFVEFEFG
jgi:hypothetical protein